MHPHLSVVSNKSYTFKNVVAGAHFFFTDNGSFIGMHCSTLIKTTEERSALEYETAVGATNNHTEPSNEGFLWCSLKPFRSIPTTIKIIEIVSSIALFLLLCVSGSVYALYSEALRFMAS